MKKMLLLLLITMLALVGCQKKEPLTFKDKLCVLVSHADESCQIAYHFDAEVPLVFYENDQKDLMVAILNDAGNKALEITGAPQLFKQIEDGELFTWHGSEVTDQSVALIYGLADDSVQSVVVESEGNIQANRIRIDGDLSLWYVANKDGQLTMPIKVKAYGEGGNIIGES
ncbi:hypothetical protein [Bacillus solimangrovi]|uniref:Uncharacterized protein n=1 Tax=Bacillus solimangrovi TaxID=1305675 RepID=A0A1E5LCZ4_9BACI|nr:hypothetical protein [Bacillus solimangrovi]OEH91957.1 hypothetical protein BFG57_17505 [Bacillus solimangrovi]